MPRKKKEVEVVNEKKAVDAVIKTVDYGTGRARINNMLQAGFKYEEIIGGKKNE